jgi:hypothetical protein
VFSSEERIQQTIKQCESIKKQIPTATIVLLESSNLNLNDLYRLSLHTNFIVLFYLDSALQTHSTGQSKNKNLSEIYVSLYMTKLLSGQTFGHLVKFGGRYRLTSDFSPLEFFRDKPVIKTLDSQYSYSHRSVGESILYSIPNSYLGKYSELLHNAYSNIRQYIDIEHALFHLEHIHISQLNVTGSYASGIPNYA